MPNRARFNDEIQAMLPELKAAVRADDCGWRRVRSWPTSVRNAASLGFLLLLNAIVVLGSPRTDLGVLPAVRTVAAIIVLLAFASLGATLFLRPLHRRRAPRAVFGSAVVALSVLPMAFSLLPASHDAVAAHPESFVGVAADFWPRVLGCLFYGTLVGVPVAAILFVMDRRPHTGAGRLLLAAGFGGAAGTLGLFLHCPLESVAHRVTGHGGIAASVALVLAAVLLMIRSRRNSGATA